MVLIKLHFKGEIHLLSKSPDSFEHLLKAIQNSFKIISTNELKLSYTDSDGDRIVIALARRRLLALLQCLLLSH